MNRTKLLFLIFGLTVFTNGVSQKKITENNYHLIEIPPSGIKINEKLFCDQVEMTNLGWQEYVFWTKKVYGADSDEYKNSLPDTLVWTRAGNCLSEHTNYYFRHSTYRNYPVVGITQEQAIQYTKWRSDRYFEYLLVKLKKIKFDPDQNRDTHFTTERYYTGQLNTLLSEDKVEYYPEFRLPTLEEREMILSYADTTDKDYFNSCETDYCRECRAHFPKIKSDITPCQEDTFDIEPTINVREGCASKKGKPIYNLRGNVNEWTNEPNIAAGGGWRNYRQKIMEAETYRYTSQNAWTGFRNVCEWKQWKPNP